MEEDSKESDDDEFESEDVDEILNEFKSTLKSNVVTSHEPEAVDDASPVVKEETRAVGDSISNEKKEEMVTSDVVAMVSEDKTDMQWQIIDRIRREKFGVGVEMDEKLRELFENQTHMLKRSLDRLSKDLYS